MTHSEDGWRFGLDSSDILSMPEGCQTVHQIYISSPTSDHWNQDIPSHNNSSTPDFEEPGFDASLSPRFTSANVSTPASPSASHITRSPGPLKLTTIVIPNWRDDDERRIFSCKDSSVFADPIFKDTMKKADEITRSGIDPEQSRVELSELMDFANSLVSHRTRQQKQEGTLEVNSTIPFFTLLPPHKDRGTEADFGDQDDIWRSGYCAFSKKERDVISLKTNLQELFPGTEMFYGQSPNNSDEICKGTDIMKHWKERADGTVKRVPRGWRYPIEFNQCHQSSKIPTIFPINPKYLDGTSLATSPEKLSGEGRAPEIDSQITLDLNSSIVGTEGGQDKFYPGHANGRDLSGSGESDKSFAENEGTQKQSTTDMRDETVKLIGGGM